MSGAMGAALRALASQLDTSLEALFQCLVPAPPACVHSTGLAFVIRAVQVVGLATGVGAAGVSASVLTSMFTNPLEDLLALTLSAAGG